MSVNYIAVIVSGVVYFMLGGLWYSPVLFAKPWLKAIGKTPEEIKAQCNPVPGYILSFIGSLLTAFMLAVAINYVGAASLIDGAKIGFYIWLGFVITTQVPHSFFENRPKGLLLIYAGYTLVAFVIMGGILGAWK